MMAYVLYYQRLSLYEIAHVRQLLWCNATHAKLFLIYFQKPPWCSGLKIQIAFFCIWIMYNTAIPFSGWQSWQAYVPPGLSTNLTPLKTHRITKHIHLLYSLSLLIFFTAIIIYRNCHSTESILSSKLNEWME